jgi:hypothetical protein
MVQSHPNRNHPSATCRCPTLPADSLEEAAGKKAAPARVAKQPARLAASTRPCVRWTSALCYSVRLLTRQRPLQAFTFAALYQLFGLHSLGYHLFNACLLVAVAGLPRTSSRASFRLPGLVCAARPLVYSTLREVRARRIARQAPLPYPAKRLASGESRGDRRGLMSPSWTPEAWSSSGGPRHTRTAARHRDRPS